MKIKHIHAGVGYFNGSLFFLVDNRLLRVGVGTPNYNDYGEWRLDEFTLSNEVYKPDDNNVELKPYDFEDIEINEEDLKFLELGSKMCADDMTDKEVDDFIEKHPDWNSYLAACRFEGDECITFLIESEEGEDRKVKYSDWLELQKVNLVSSFEKIFYPILNNFREQYIKQNK